MKATEVLSNEHRGIERMLGILERDLPRLEAGDASVVPVYAQGVDFLKTFADKCHHHKEEGYLFPLLAKKGIPTQSGPIAVMLSEHDQGRGYVKAMGEAAARAQTGDKRALADLAEATRGYIGLLRAHILKEDQVLFRMADGVLTPADHSELVKTFEVVEEEEMGAGTHERYHHMLDALESGSEHDHDHDHHGHHHH